MRKSLNGILLMLFFASLARADTALTIPALCGCLADFGSVVGIQNPPTVVGIFSLSRVSGQGSIQSQVPSYWDEKYPRNGIGLAQKQAEITDLKQRLEKVEQLINDRNEGTK